MVLGCFSSYAKKHVSDSAEFSWENAVVRIQTTARAVDYMQPWKQGPREGLKFGVVVDDHLILTTAEGLENNTEIQLQKSGLDNGPTGKIVWIDYQTNLALVGCDDSSFWTGLNAAQLPTTEPTSGPVQILRWSGTDFENRKGQVDRVHVVNSDLSSISVPAIRIVDTNIQSAGLSEAVAQGDELIGLGNAQDGDTLDAVPGAFINGILRDWKAHKYTGIGYFDFTWDQIQNSLNLEYLRMPSPARGVIVRQTAMKPGYNELIHPRDVILSIDGFDVDSQGNYEDPQYGKLCLENLSCRNKWSGQVCHIKVWRDGKEVPIDYVLPKAEFTDYLVPPHRYDMPGYYVNVAGLVFVPLTDDYLRNWGTSWRVQFPLELDPYKNGSVTPERRERVVVSQILPADINISYESVRGQVVDKVNGITIKDLSGLVLALKSPVNGFDIFEFESGNGPKKVVFPADQIEEQTEEISRHYRLPRSSVLPDDTTLN